jgi:hypothetical protein
MAAIDYLTLRSTLIYTAPGVQAPVGSIFTVGSSGVQTPVSTMTVLTTGNVGIGIATPTAALHIKNAITSMRITGNLSNTSTRPALSTTPRTFEIRGSGSTDGNDDGFLRLSAGGGSSTASQSYIDISGYSTVPDMVSNIVLGTAGAERMRITSSGNVGIGTNAPGASYALHVVGAIYATGNISAFSDQRYKQNIVRLDRSLDAIRSLSGYYYTREDYEPGIRQIGLLAQEVKAVLPEAVCYDSANDKYSVNYNCLIAPVVEAIKELYDRSEAQAKIIQDQQAEIHDQQSAIQAQQSAIQAQQSTIQKLLDHLTL